MRRSDFGRFTHFAVLLVSVLVANAALATENRTVYRAKFTAAGKYLMVELLADDIAHFELSASLPGPDESLPLATSPMVGETNFPGPTKVLRHGPFQNILETESMVVEVNPSTLCVKYKDKVKNTDLTELCPRHLDQYWKGFTFTQDEIQNYYGLGQEFHDAGQPDGDWMGRVRHYGGLHGNKMVDFNGGANGNTQIPILYALGPDTLNYAFFLDSIYQQQWDFTSDPNIAEMYGEHIRWYFLTGPSLPSLRKRYMDIVGRPLVPPKKAFGLWVSEYGFRDWAHLESKLATLRTHQFPIDGFMLDLFWFGGIKSDSDDTSMGRLTWDTSKFPSPEKKLASLRDDEGVSIIPIEESYIGKNLNEHKELEKRGFLAKTEAGDAAYLSTGNKWWGKGGLIDWTNPGVGDYWHVQKRMPLIQAGIFGHWLDLGEPELFPAKAVYANGKRQPDVHNIYNLKWIESVYKGYEKYTPDLRPFLLSRSGAAGIQRYGAAMWSGDIGSDLTSLAAHQNAQMHMSLSGVDYYGSDIGGFHREALKGNLDEMYTQWFAYGMLFDIPGRPHTENLCDCRETSPDRVGDINSNRENIQWRYRLIPYVYSLAHQAYNAAEPVFPPLVYYFQNDPKVRTLGREKMIGPSLLATVTARQGQSTTSIYLPKGTWYDFYSGKTTKSVGQTLSGISLSAGGKFRLPLYAKAGAIIPMMFVDEQTMNSTGRRLDGSKHDELILRLFPDETESFFTLFEDDGASTAYRKGAVRKTEIHQFRFNNKKQVVIEPSQGSYKGMVRSRNNVLEVYHEGERAEAVLLNGKPLSELSSKSEWQRANSGWFTEKGKRTFVKSGSVDVLTKKTFEIN